MLENKNLLRALRQNDNVKLKKIVRYLSLKFKKKPDDYQDKINKLLVLAARNHRVCHIKFLIKRGASINFHNYRGRTPLHNAVLSGGTKVACFLIANGADLFALDKELESPMHIAARSCMRTVHIIYKLLDKNVSLNLLNIKQQTPLDILDKKITYYQKDNSKLKRLHKLRQRLVTAGALNADTLLLKPVIKIEPDTDVAEADYSLMILANIASDKSPLPLLLSKQPIKPDLQQTSFNSHGMRVHNPLN